MQGLVDAETTAIISNGTVKLGINQEGHLNVWSNTPSWRGVWFLGLRFIPTNAEATAPGCLCEGWGAADAITRVSGAANEDDGVWGMIVESFTADASTATSVVNIQDTLRVTHFYHPSASPNLFQADVAITNISSDPVELLYRRVMDWDVEPTTFWEFVTIDTGVALNLVYTSNNGFASADPLSARSDLGFTGSFTDAGPRDHGAFFEFNFGTLPPGETKEFRIFYGAAATEVEAHTALGDVGAEAYSFGQPSTPDGPTLGTPNTFIFAFSGIGGVPVDPTVREVTPPRAGNAGAALLTVSGAAFRNGATVKLAKMGSPDIEAAETTFVNPWQLRARFDLSGAETGVYDVVVTNPDGRTATLAAAFEVIEGGEARLFARLQVPASVRPNRDYICWLEYGNEGTLAMPVPLFIVSSPQNAPMRLSTADPWRRTPIQALGIGFETPTDTLLPGARYRIPVYFQATNTAEVRFDLSQMVADDSAIDWTAIEPGVRPEDVDPDAWSVIWSQLTAQIGSTWADYLGVLSADATYLADNGSRTFDARKLFAFEISKATHSFGPRGALAAAVDAYAPGSGLPLVFVRVAGASIDQRFRNGPLGRGWSHNWEYVLTQPEPSRIVIKGPAGSARTFTMYTGWSWQGEPGDYGMLTADGLGGYLLREKNGVMSRFDGLGQLGYVEEANGNRLSMTYAGGQLIGVAHSGGQTLAFTYDAAGRITRLTDHAGRQTIYTYVGDHLAEVTGPGGIITAYAYHPATGSPLDHALDAITFPDGTHRYYSYDVLGRLAEQSGDGGAERVQFSLDAFGTMTMTDALGSSSILSLGAFGEPLSAFDPLNRSVQFRHSDRLNLTGLTGPDGGASSVNYDGRGNPQVITDPAAQVTSLAYTGDFSRLDWLRDARGNVMDLTTDAFGNLTAITYPDTATERFGYDGAGNVVSVTNRRGQTINYTYDAQGRITRKEYPDGRTVDFSYDARGNLLAVADSVSGTITMEYDGRDFLTRIEYPDGRWFSFEYNNAAQRTRRTGHDGYVLNYTYDAVGRLERLTDGTPAEIVNYQYDAAGRLIRENKGNGTYTTYEYDAAGQVIHMVNYAPDGTVQSRFDYTYDVNGNPISMATLTGTWFYGYDATGQLVSVAHPDGDLVTYEYDTAGNRTVVTDDGVPTLYTTNNMNQYTQVGDTAYTYDVDGNMVSQTDATGTTTYEYDDENRLVRVAAPAGDTWKYTYDALGNRIAVTHNSATTNYLHDPIGLVDVAAEYDGAGALIVRYAHGIGLVSRIGAAGDPAYYAYDATGHTRQMTSNSGAVVNSYEYDAYGNPITTAEAIANRFRYVGRYGVMDVGNALNYMRARYYHTATGRFLTTDPSGVLGGLHPYRYCLNNPISLVDPVGLRSCWLHHGNWLGECNSGGRNDTPRGGMGALWVPPLDTPDAASKFHDWLVHKNVADAQVIASRYLLNELRKKVSGGGTITSEEETWSQLFLLGALFGVLDRDLDIKSARRDLSDDELVALFNHEVEEAIRKHELSSDSTPVVRPVDPNEKVGPPGYGPDRIVSVESELTYVIYFENLPAATAPAQEVRITDVLDADLDWPTFRATEVAFGSHVVSLTGESGTYAVRENADPWWVDITAEIDYRDGTVVWLLRTIDPATGELPEDALAGFLPPNDATGRGEGHVTFSIKPRTDRPDGTRVVNQATIVFDTEPPITTNEVFNTLVTFLNVPPEVEISPATQDVQYSDPIEDIAVTATDAAADELEASTAWSVDGGASTPGLPNGLMLVDEGCTIINDTKTCTWRITGPAGIPEGSYTIEVTVNDDHGGSTTVGTALNVLPEDASVEFDAGNPVAVQVDLPGGDSGPFALYVELRETVPDLSEVQPSAPGDIGLAVVSMTLASVGPGGPSNGMCTPVGVVGTGYDAVLTVRCEFDNVPVNTYSAEVTVNAAGYYTGASEDVLVVFDPSLGFTTGGGWFYWPGTEDRTNFGYNMKYNRRRTNVQGSLLLIRHMPDGSLYRIKSNSLYGLALGEQGGADPFGWASFSGKCTYKEPGWLEPLGGYEFVVYVEDRGEPGAGHDRFWLRTLDRDGAVEPDLSMSEQATDNAILLEGGNIVVPHERH